MQRQWKRTLAGVALLMALGSTPAMAATITVTTNDPIVNPLDLQCSLIEAINNANDNLTGISILPTSLLNCAPGTPNGADTIVLPANTIHTIPFCNINFRGNGCTGLAVIRSQITINGNGSTIRRDPANPITFRIFAVARGGSDMGNLTLQNTTVSGGSTNGTGQAGGGVYNYRGNLTITNSTISGNRTRGTSSDGGGVFNRSGTTTITNSTISGNSTSYSYRASRGGGLHNSYGTMTVTGSTISGNSTTGGDSDCGGMYNFRGTTTITNSTISGNSTSGNYSNGGGVCNRGGPMTVTNSTISGNRTLGIESAGGGVFNSDNGTLTVTSSTISGNHTNGRKSAGGGVLNRGGTMNVTNSTLWGNRTFGGLYSHGGGVYNDGGNLTLTNSTITRNVASGNASFGGGVFNDGGTLALTRTIISGNFHATGLLYFSEVVSIPIITSNGFNLFGHRALTTAQALNGVTPGATDITATSNGKRPTLITSILDIVLRTNGGPTRTNALVPGSPAIDAVTTGCPSGLRDQRGILRPRDGNGDGIARCDIGAFERQSATVP